MDGKSNEIQKEAAPPSHAGVIEISFQSSISCATRLFSTYPLRILHPKRVQFDKTIDCAWFYTVSYGGGLVSGDSVPMSVAVLDNCTACICTQGTTKVYKAVPGRADNLSGSKTTTQTLEATVEENALLCWLPDPAQCFRDARFSQIHDVTLRDASSSLCFVDWITAGRVAHDDARWAFRSFSTRTTVVTKALDERGEDMINVIESQRLENSVDVPDLLSKHMVNAHVLASVILIGPRTKEARQSCKDVVRAKSGRSLKVSDSRWLKIGCASSSSSFSTISESTTTTTTSDFNSESDCLVLRVCASDVEAAYEFLRETLKPLENEIGCPPYGERGGS